MQSSSAERRIIDRGRGPELSGTRITVDDVMDYLIDGWHRDRIARLFRLSSRDIQVAIDYIDQHREEVEAGYRRITQRHRNYQYAPEVQARIESSRGAARRRREEIRRQREESSAQADR